MGKTIIKHVAEGLGELLKDTAKEGGKATKEIVVGVPAGLVGLDKGDSPEKVQELQKKDQQNKGRQIAALHRVLAEETQASRQPAHAVSQSREKPQQRSVEYVPLPASGRHQPGIPGLGRKKAKTNLFPTAPSSTSSVESKHAGRD